MTAGWNKQSTRRCDETDGHTDAPDATNALQDFARIHQLIGIDGAFDRTHQIMFDR